MNAWTADTVANHHERRSYLVNSGGEQIYAERTGVGAPVVLCHGLGGNHAIWWRQIDAFAAAHEVVSWDQRGFGNSTAVTGQAGIVVAAGDLLAVLDALGLPKVALVGQSMGAFVALQFAARHPERVTSMVISTSLAGADPRHTRALNAAVSPRSLRDSHPVLSPQFCAAQPDLAILYNAISSFGAKPPIARMLEAMASEGLTDAEMARLTCPVLVLAAAYDQLCPPEVMAEVARRIQGAHFQALAAVGHSAYYEQPTTWNAAVLGFLT